MIELTHWNIFLHTFQTRLTRVPNACECYLGAELYHTCTQYYYIGKSELNLAAKVLQLLLHIAEQYLGTYLLVMCLFELVMVLVAT